MLGIVVTPVLKDETSLTKIVTVRKTYFHTIDIYFEIFGQQTKPTSDPFP